jgi:quercetin dioxygenase-like cupin family protein
MEFLTDTDFRHLVNPGVVSEQLVSPDNSASERVTITRVTVRSRAVQPRHCHESSEQIWIALSGAGRLLLANGRTHPFAAGNVARFEDREMHGFENTSDDPFIYIAVTSPPIDFESAYAGKR